MLALCGSSSTSEEKKKPQRVTRIHLHQSHLCYDAECSPVPSQPPLGITDSSRNVSGIFEKKTPGTVHPGPHVQPCSIMFTTWALSSSTLIVNRQQGNTSAGMVWFQLGKQRQTEGKFTHKYTPDSSSTRNPRVYPEAGRHFHISHLKMHPAKPQRPQHQPIQMQPRAAQSRPEPPSLHGLGSSEAPQPLFAAHKGIPTACMDSTLPSTSLH